MTDCYSKLARTVPCSRTSVTHMSKLFSDHWILSCVIPAYILSDNGSQFVSKFIRATCGFPGAKPLTRTAHCPQTNSQDERYDRTLVGRLRPFASVKQDIWDAFIQLLTYAYSRKMHRSSGETPCSLTLMRESPGPASGHMQSAGTTNLKRDTLPKPMRPYILLRLSLMRTKVDKSLNAALRKI